MLLLPGDCGDQAGVRDNRRRSLSPEDQLASPFVPVSDNSCGGPRMRKAADRSLDVPTSLGNDRAARSLCAK
jgi:hypothetical protein